LIADRVHAAGASCRFLLIPVVIDEAAVHHEKSPLNNGLFLQRVCKRQAAANQYPALNGLLMRSASGDTSSSLSVGIGSSPSALFACWASFARSPWPMSGERATEKNRNI
jgi:hypothetical protein